MRFPARSVLSAFFAVAVHAAADTADFPTNAPPNAGLWQVRLQGQWNKTDPIPTNEAAGARRMPGPAMAHVPETRSFRWGGADYGWQHHQTWAYSGYMFMTGGVQYVFGKSFDDSCLLRIDGQTVVDHGIWNLFATGTFIPDETGWHEIEIRLGNVDGCSGPWGNWQGHFGLAFNMAGQRTPTPVDAWTPMRDDTGALFRTEPVDWVPDPLPPPDPAALAAMIPGQRALGGDEVHRVGRDIVHVFRTGGVFRTLSPVEARVLLVGGGGMGGAEIGAGGGGGGVLDTHMQLSTNKFYYVFVGAGGRLNPKDHWEPRSGGDTLFGRLAARGGGGGGNWRHPAGAPGGNGGGGANGGKGGDAVQDGGNPGGAANNRMPGGGGGAGAPGGRAEGGQNVDAPAGGDGVPSDITGEEVWYGGGGGAGQESRGRLPGPGGRGGGGSGTTDPHGPAPENHGVDGLGGGGGGACNNWGVPVSDGGRGGDGVAVVRYRGDWTGVLAIGDVSLKAAENRKGRPEVHVEGELLSPGAGGLRASVRVGLTPAEARAAQPFAADYAGNERFTARFSDCGGAPLFSGCEYFVAVEAVDRAGGRAAWEGSVRVPPVPLARGGDIRFVDGDVVHVFETNGRFELDRRVVADVLLVGGGGAGGSAFGGGGGGGGVVELHGVALEPDHYKVVVGEGGKPVFSSARGAGRRGGDTTFLGRRARGGGGGAGWERSATDRRGTVATGGGASQSAPGRAAGDGQGYDGGGATHAESGGGGGAGGPGEKGGASRQLRSGAGGAGRVSSITGEAVSYGPGGGGGAASNYDSMPGFGGDPDDRVSGRGAANHAETPGAPGRDGRGGGGGGGTWNPATSGGAGGSGVVIVRYTPRPDFPELASLRVKTHRRGIAVEGAVAAFGDGAKRATATVQVAPDETSLDAAPALALPAMRAGRNEDFSALLRDCNGEPFEPGQPYCVRVRVENDRGARVERVEWARAPVRRVFKPRRFFLKTLLRLAP